MPILKLAQWVLRKESSSEDRPGPGFVQNQRLPKGCTLLARRSKRIWSLAVSTLAESTWALVWSCIWSFESQRKLRLPRPVQIGPQGSQRIDYLPAQLHDVLVPALGVEVPLQGALGRRDL